MEEKERYEVMSPSLNGYAYIHDLKTDNVLNTYDSCDLLNQQSKRIKELEKQLAESEKNFVIANNLRKNADEVLLNYKTEKYGLDKTIQELRKVKLSFPEKEWYYKGFENCERQMSSHIADLTLEVKELKQQLKEVENYIEEDEVCKREYYQKVDADDRKKEFLIKKLQKKGKEKDALIEQLQAENKLLKVGVKGLDDLLKSQAKEIVEEVEKNFTEYLPLKDKTGAGFYCRLNAILKKYGEANE